MSPGLIVAVRCHYCSRELPAFRTHQITGAQRICDDCLDWHNKAIEFLAGAPPPGCQACGATWEFLRDSELAVEIRMYVVPRDGIYQILCRSCVQPYLPKRADLYAGTAFGRNVLKI
jgi:hypothetical protein